MSLFEKFTKKKSVDISNIDTTPAHEVESEATSSGMVPEEE